MKRKLAFMCALLMAFVCLGCGPKPSGTNGGEGGNVGEGEKPPVVVEKEGVELFMDTDFTAFGPTESLGAEWSKGTADHLGRITKYRPLNKPIYNIPGGCATEDDGVTATAAGQNIHWDFIEGEKKNITDREGTRIGELLDFRLSVDYNLEENTDERLVFTQYNDYYHNTYPAKYGSDPKLVKRIETDKKGTIKLAYNSYNDISNEAYSFSSKFANNTWPHLYLNQNFHEPVDLALYEKINYEVSIKLNKATAVNNWPRGSSDRLDQPDVPAGEPNVSVAQVQGYCLLRDKAGGSCWFVGLSHYSSNASDRAENFANEQHGVPFYRIGLEQEQGAYYDMTSKLIENVGDSTTVKFDLYKQIRYVLDRKLRVNDRYVDGGVNRYYGKTIDDYVIADFHIGWENVGNWDCEVEISDLSMRGILKKTTSD